MKAKDWSAMYADKTDPTIANTLREAKEKGLKYYRNNCSVHGPSIFYTLDNSCPHCTNAAHKRRRANRAFNRPRELCGETKHRAKKRGLEHNLTTDYVRGLLADFNECPVLGIPMEYGEGQASDLSPSIDRLDSRKGYVEGNVTITSTRANRIKSNGEWHELLSVALWMMKQRGMSEELIVEYIENIFFERVDIDEVQKET